MEGIIREEKRREEKKREERRRHSNVGEVENIELFDNSNRICNHIMDVSLVVEEVCN